MTTIINTEKTSQERSVFHSVGSSSASQPSGKMTELMAKSTVHKEQMKKHPRPLPSTQRSSENDSSSEESDNSDSSSVQSDNSERPTKK